jgi:hypothetical protein
MGGERRTAKLAVRLRNAMPSSQVPTVVDDDEPRALPIPRSTCLVRYAAEPAWRGSGQAATFGRRVRPNVRASQTGQIRDFTARFFAPRH